MSRATREAERNIRSSEFLQENITDYTGNEYLTGEVGTLQGAIELAGDMREEQISADGDVRQQYEIIEETDEALYHLLRDVADYAVSAADRIDGIEEKFRVSRTGGKRGRIARARAFATDAEPHRELLVGRGLDATFITDLRALADRLEQSLAAAASTKGRRVGATEAKMNAHRQANKIIRTIDPLIRRRYRDDPAKLAAWDFVSRVARDPVPKKPKENKK